MFSVFSVVPFCCCGGSRTTTENTESTEPSRADQGRADQGRTGQGRAGQGRAGQTEVRQQNERQLQCAPGGVARRDARSRGHGAAAWLRDGAKNFAARRSSDQVGGLSPRPPIADSSPMARARAPSVAGDALRGTYVSCALLTVLTIALAWPGVPESVAAMVPPAYFGLLLWFFARAAAVSPELRGEAMSLIVAGFAINFAGSTTSACIGYLPQNVPDSVLAYVRLVCDTGAVFLLGTTLSTFGLMLWIPHVVANHRQLAERELRQRGELDAATTERSQLEQHLVDADRRGMLAELAASIAHDLRNPLTIVKGSVESMCRRPRTQHELAEHATVILRNVDKADRTIEALIDLARPQTRTATEVPPLRALEEVADLLRTEARRRGVPLTIDRSAAACAPLRTDRTLLTQALLNLGLNALQASPAGQPVTLRARPMRQRHAVALVVEDRGAGLPATIRRNKFTPFFTTKPGGTGLGLVSCRRIAAELGGALRLHPRGRGGSRALLVLPLAAAAAASTPTPQRNTSCATSNC
ncbi:MAG: sensor histidine kinase [Planctomycetota bacterium]